MQSFKFCFLILFFFLLISQNALSQTVGAYGSTFYSDWATYGREYLLKPAGGVFINGFLKGSFNPGIDIQYSSGREKKSEASINMDIYPFYSATDSSVYITDQNYFNSILDIKLDLEFTSSQTDTFVVAFGFQPGLARLTDKMEFSNPALKDLAFQNWVPSLGGSGTIRRNYVFGKPLQIFFSISYQSYFTKANKYDKEISSAFQSKSTFTVGYAKLGMAYIIK